MSPEERALIEKLLKIEALHAGATTPGERAAAANARDRILERLRATEKVDPPVAYKFTLHDPWQRRVFLALARRYGLRPYREYGQHRQTVMVKVSRRFVNETLWPEYLALAEALDTYLDAVTTRVIGEAIHKDSSEAEEVRSLPGG